MLPGKFQIKISFTLLIKQTINGRIGLNDKLYTIKKRVY